MSANNFGPLTTGRFTYNSTSQSIHPGLFSDSWKAQGSSGNGKTALAEYTMCMPTGENAYFHMLLDASGSTWQKVKTGDKKRVFKHLFGQFAQVAMNEGTFRPNDVIYVWSFNMRVKLLWRGDRRSFQKNHDFIRAEYKKELDGTNYKETRLYDAVATVMETIRETHKAHRKADFFLVPFTDGVDNKSVATTLNGMMESVNSLVGRLHTYFITVNMPPKSELFLRLESQQNEITHINCENTEPNEISRAFNTLRECIKAFLLLAYTSQGAHGSEMHLTRIADYGRSRHEVADRMMMHLSREMHNTSLMEGWNSLRTLGPAQ